MLTLPIKKKWFDMILSGEKKEEYREIKPYWTTRFKNIFYIPQLSCDKFLEGIKIDAKPGIVYRFRVCFRNGYSSNSSSFIAKVSLSIGTGKEEWGAENGKYYFVLTINEILKGSEET